LRAANFGILAPTYRLRDITVNPADIPIFEYLRPRGGAAEPFRLGDFRNYNHAARPPLSLMMNSLSLEAATPVSGTSQLLVVSPNDYANGRRVGYRVNLTQITNTDISISEFFNQFNADQRLTVIIGAVENGSLTTRQDLIRVFQSPAPINFIAGAAADHELIIDTSRLAQVVNGVSPPLAVGQPYILHVCVMPNMQTNQDGTWVGNVDMTVPTLRMTAEPRFNTLVSGDLQQWQAPTQNINVAMSFTGTISAFRANGQIELWNTGELLNISTTPNAPYEIWLSVTGGIDMNIGMSMPNSITIPDVGGNQLTATFSVRPVQSHHNFVGQTSVSQNFSVF
jgi:hypothetical protein